MQQNKNSYKAFNVGSLFPQENKTAAKLATKSTIARQVKQKRRIMQVVTIEDNKTTIKEIVKKIKSK